MLLRPLRRISLILTTPHIITRLGQVPNMPYTPIRISILKLSMLIRHRHNSSRHRHRRIKYIPIPCHQTRAPAPASSRTITCPPIPNTPPRAARPLLRHVQRTHPPPPTQHSLEIGFPVSSATGRLLVRTIEGDIMRPCMLRPPSYIDVVTVGRISVARTHLNATSIMDATRCCRTNRFGNDFLIIFQPNLYHPASS
jgi:hypothetical protein